MKTKKNIEWRLPDECVACGAEHSYTRIETRTEKNLRGETFTVPHHHWKCGACGVAILGDAEMDEAMRATVAAYQGAHDLLTAREIREARARLNWSQRELAERSGVGIATIKRLELGGVVQTDTNDRCLRDTMSVALKGCLVFMVTHEFDVSTEWMTEIWDQGWQPQTSVSQQSVELDFCDETLCPCP